MEVLINPESLPKQIKRLAITIGNFDGIHLGHQSLINKVIAISNNKNSTSGIITFSPHPNKSLDGSKAPALLINLKKKIQIFQGMGLQLMALFDFNHTFSRLLPECFIKEYIVDILHAKDIVIGENFRFGKNGSGDPVLLQLLGEKYGFETHIMKSLYDNGNIISSTNIRNLIKKGEIAKANSLLGRYFSISGKVQKGKGIGRKLGFPTANIPLPIGIVPRKGVYITLCCIGRDYLPSLTNIGTTPSITNRPLTIEVHILNKNIDLYNEDIEIFFIERIRDEKYFENIDDLKNAIKNDREYASQYFRRGDMIYNGKY